MPPFSSSVFHQHPSPFFLPLIFLWTTFFPSSILRTTPSSSVPFQTCPLPIPFSSHSSHRFKHVPLFLPSLYPHVFFPNAFTLLSHVIFLIPVIPSVHLLPGSTPSSVDFFYYYSSSPLPRVFLSPNILLSLACRKRVGQALSKNSYPESG